MVVEIVEISAEIGEAAADSTTEIKIKIIIIAKTNNKIKVKINKLVTRLTKEAPRLLQMFQLTHVLVTGRRVEMRLTAVIHLSAAGLISSFLENEKLASLTSLK